MVSNSIQNATSLCPVVFRIRQSEFWQVDLIVEISVLRPLGNSFRSIFAGKIFVSSKGKLLTESKRKRKLKILAE